MAGKKALAKKKAETARKKASAPAKKPKQVFEVDRDDAMDSDLELEPSTSEGENSAIVYIGWGPANSIASYPRASSIRIANALSAYALPSRHHYLRYRYLFPQDSHLQRMSAWLVD